MITREFHAKKPPFFTRLSNLIILQILFIFAAFGLLFLYPVKEEIATTDPSIIEEKFELLAETIRNCNEKKEIKTCSDELKKTFKKSFSHLDCLSSNVYVYDSNGVVVSLPCSGFMDEYKYTNFDKNYIHFALLKSENHLMQTIPSTQNIVYYYTFDLTDTQKGLLAAEFEHHYFVTSENKVLYTFGLLFLGGILISLLTIYLINKRIREPLARLMKGFEKTTQGDIYYMVETNKDIELNKLSESFNKMSRTLWDNDQRLKRYNQRLVDANKNLLDSREFLQKILNNSTSSIITTSPDGIIQVFNETAGEHFELSSKKAIGSHIKNYFTDDLDFNSLDIESQEEVEVVCKKSDGTVFPAFLLLAPIYDSNINISFHLYVLRDITESKSIHNMMIKMDRYYTKGEMAGDIAHEINNFLAILAGNIELMPLILKKNDPEKIKNKLELMKKQVDRIVNFTDGLLEANDGDESFVQVDINQLLKAVKSFLQPQNLFDYIAIETDLSEDIPLVHTNIGQIRQLFVNLVYNAGEAICEIEGTKIILISAKLTGEEDNKTVTITVKDNGPGLAKENIDYLFNKRFTTKPHGHGISLVACQKIVDSHFGLLKYRYDNGALFTVVLPITQNVEEQTEPTQSDSNSIYA